MNPTILTAADRISPSRTEGEAVTKDFLELESLAIDIKRLTAEACAYIAEGHSIDDPENEFHRGYNGACADIAQHIRKMIAQ